MRAWPRLPGALLATAAFALASAATASAAAPSIVSQSVTDVTATNARLRAQIDDGGLLTRYKLQIDVTGNFKFPQNDGCVLHPPGHFCTQAVVPGEPQPAGLLQPHENTLSGPMVSVNLGEIGSMLQPETTYYYRAIAANTNGFAYGATKTFTTPGPFDPPPEEVPPPPEDEPDLEEPDMPAPEPDSPRDALGVTPVGSIAATAPLAAHGERPARSRGRPRCRGRQKSGTAQHRARRICLKTARQAGAPR